MKMKLARASRAAIAGGARPAHYIVRLAFGKRAEPWIMAVRAEQSIAPAK